MNDEQLSPFGVSEVECDQCRASGTLFRIRHEPFPNDGGDWPEVIVLCEDCMIWLRDAITAEMKRQDFSRGLE